MLSLQDILNHVFDDLERFMQLLKDKAAAWTELERKSQKSRRKKHDGMYNTSLIKISIKLNILSRVEFSSVLFITLSS